MTSVERSAHNSYRGIVCPSYNAISYTWGRFVDGNERSIQINNVPWRIPSIRVSHFSVADFEAAIKVAGAGVSFVWLDVACIDQEDPHVKIDEIGNQAAIFKNASRVFAWAVPWEHGALEGCLLTMERFCAAEAPEVETSYSMKSERSNAIVPTMNSLLDAVRELRFQHWFTSLWTLQEAYLRKDAVLLSRSSKTPSLVSRVDQSYELPIPLTWLLERCMHIFAICSSKVASLALDISQLLMDSGLLALGMKNEWSLYSAATRRQASLPEDRVYGIMQVYNIRLGAQPSISRLEDALGFTLNGRSPVLAQLHMHEGPVEKGKAWRLSRSMAIPYVYLNVLTAEASCAITSTPRMIPLFDGEVCGLPDLVDLWQTAAVTARRLGRPSYQVHVILDAQTSQPGKTLQLLDAETNIDSFTFKDLSASRVRFDDLSSHLHSPLEQYNILLLGEAEIEEHDLGKNDCIVRYGVGLLVSQQHESARKPWARIGVCTWRVGFTHEAWKHRMEPED